MKKLILLFLVIGFFSCNHHQQNPVNLQKRIDKLEAQIANSYKPGFGEIMNNIQRHHLKLWYAGKNQNWKLVDFEIEELKEEIENIEKFQKNRKEAELIDMMEPSIDSLEMAVEQKNADLFNSSYRNLTVSCNNCHKLTNFEFNIVKIPDGESPFLNQDFKQIK